MSNSEILDHRVYFSNLQLEKDLYEERVKNYQSSKKYLEELPKKQNHKIQVKLDFSFMFIINNYLTIDAD